MPQETHHQREHEEKRQEHAEEHATETTPVFHPSRPVKILISPGGGQGWSTEAPHGVSDAFRVWMLTYEPLIKAVGNHAGKDRLEQVMQDFHKECRVQHVEHIAVTRPGDLEVREVDHPFEVAKERGGSEKIVKVVDTHGRRLIHM